MRVVASDIAALHAKAHLQKDRPMLDGEVPHASDSALVRTLRHRIASLERQLVGARRPPCGVDGALSPVAIDGDALFATVQVARLDAAGASIRMPHGVKHVLIEIGVSDVDTMDRQVLGVERDAFLLSFEPLLDKYAVLAARGDHRFNRGRPNMAVPVGYYHQRGVILPLSLIHI